MAGNQSCFFENENISEIAYDSFIINGCSSIHLTLKMEREIYVFLSSSSDAKPFRKWLDYKRERENKKI